MIDEDPDLPPELQEPDLEIYGYFDREILFRFRGKKYSLRKHLPKVDLMLKFGIKPDEVKSMRDAILIEAHSKPLTYSDVEYFWRHL